MPRGKELEQLPTANVGAPIIGDDQSKMNRTSLKGAAVPDKRSRIENKNKS